MAGPPPQEQRRRRNVPARGEWQEPVAVGWQHGEVPKPPEGMTVVTRRAWATWFAAWFAAHWTPDDVPILRQLLRLYDRIERGEASSAERSEFRQLADNYGITPKGQQDRRWKPPQQSQPAAEPVELPDPYSSLRIVS